MIHAAIMDLLEAQLTADLITNISAADEARVGVVKQGPLQGEPDPDEARISVTLHENDPDEWDDARLAVGWLDQIIEVEIGGYATWSRKFTINARCLLEGTQEELAAARRIASTVRSRIERSLLGISFASINVNGEIVSRRILAESLHGRVTQAGGPPDSYDFHIKLRFDLWTTAPPPGG